MTTIDNDNAVLYTVCTDASVKIPTDPHVHVLGVTTVDEKLFVLLHRDDNQVAVYSINDYEQLHHLSVPGIQRQNIRDIASCGRHTCLYMSDYSNCCIHRYDWTSKAASKWPVPGKPLGLSVTRNCNLLVTCREPNTLVELDDRGERVHEIALQPDIEHPWHAVQLTDNQFIICHGFENSLHQVCVVGDDGKVTHSYGSQRGSDIGQLSRPRHVVVDNDSQFIFVADRGNNRVALLTSPTLKFVRYVRGDLSEPRRLNFHQSTRRLFVGHWGADVTAIQL